jgi:hypothetical protein
MGRAAADGAAGCHEGEFRRDDRCPQVRRQRNGPFWIEATPDRAMGAIIARGTTGSVTWFEIPSSHDVRPIAAAARKTRKK